MESDFSSTSSSFWKYYYENGTLKKQGAIKNGNKDGEWVYYYEDGDTKSKGVFKEGTKDGVWESYYEEEVLKSSSVYAEGKGTYTEYHSNGNLKVKGFLRNNHSEGIWEYYYLNAVLQAKGLELNGVKNGYWEYFYDSGQLKSKGDYLAGKQVGEWIYYHKNGEVSSLGKHVDGKKDGHWKLYRDDGAFKGDGKYKLGDGHYKEYYDNGKLKLEGAVENEKNHGLWKYYYQDGTLEGECQFVNGQGNYIGFYKSGVVKTKGKLKDGNKIGDWVLFDEKGDVIGHYITLYDDSDSTVTGSPIVTDVDSIKSIVQVEKNASSEGHALPNYKYRKKGKWKENIRYFKPVNTHEYIGYITSINPLALVNGELPIYLEYYYQERLGYQLSYTLIRRPFFQNISNLDEGAIITRGFSVDLTQKFYSRNTDLGMLYFAHQFRYRDLNYKTSLMDTTNIREVLTPKATERGYEYVITVGNRIMEQVDYNGFTFDIYIGLGIGYRDFRESKTTNVQIREAFDQLSKNSLYLPFRFGFNFGYIFQR